jgi:formamidopyrimidine-DNA glycosylase
MAKISPLTAAKKITLEQYQKLVKAIKQVLANAIKKGGTSFRDYVDSKGNKGFFQLTLQVYGRNNQPCTNCKKPLKQIRQGQRATVYCPHCQK